MEKESRQSNVVNEGVDDRKIEMSYEDEKLIEPLLSTLKTLQERGFISAQGKNRLEEECYRIVQQKTRKILNFSRMIQVIVRIISQHPEVDDDEVLQQCLQRIQDKVEVLKMGT